LYLARRLGAHGYGTLALIMAYPMLVNTILQTRSWDVVVRFAAHDLKTGRLGHAMAVFKVCLALDFLAAVAALVLVVPTAGFAGHFLHLSGQDADLIALYAFSLLAVAPTGTCLGLLTVAGRFSHIAWQDAAFGLAELAAVVGVVETGGGVAGVVVVLLIGAFLQLGIVGLLAHRARQRLGLPAWSASRLSVLRGEGRNIARYLGSTAAFTTLKSIQQNADTLLLGRWLGPVSVGYYRVARNIANLASVPSTPIYQVTYPELARLWEGKPTSRLARATIRLIVLTAVLWGAATICLVLGAPILIEVTLGSSYLPATAALQLFLVAAWVNFSTQYLHSLLFTVGKPASAVSAFGIGLAAQGACFIFFVHRWGITGAAASFIVFAVVRAIVLAWRSWSSLAPRHIAALPPRETEGAPVS